MVSRTRPIVRISRLHDLLFHHGALGDWVLTFPLLRALGRPTVVVTASSKAQLAAALIDRVVAMDAQTREITLLFSTDGPAALGPTVHDVFDNADRVISFISDGKDAWARNIQRLTPRAEHYFVWPRPPETWPDHVCDWHRAQLRQQGLNLVEQPVSARPTAAGMNHMVVHPGSGGPEKCWPISQFEILLADLADHGTRFSVLLGEVEQERWSTADLERWRNKFGATVVPTLDALRRQLSEASLFVGNDSGPTHLAAQMGVRTIAIFGPTSPRRWAPQGPDVTVLAPTTPTDMTWLNPKDVLRACDVE